MEKFIWENPHGLFYFAAVISAAAILFYGNKKRKLIIAGFMDASLSELMISGLSIPRRRLKALLILSSLVFCVISLMGPCYDFTWETGQRRGIDIMIALDVSRSMNSPDTAPSRFERSRLEIRNLVSRFKGERTGLVIFTGTAVIQCPLTEDYDTFLMLLDEVETGSLSRGGTSLAAALERALQGFDLKNREEKIIIVLSDGETHDSNLDKALKNAVHHKVRIFCLGLGTNEGSLIPVNSVNGETVRTALTEEPLKKMARETGGAYYNAESTESGLEEIHKKHLPEIRARMHETRKKKKYNNRFYIPLAIAFILLLIEAFLRERGGNVYNIIKTR